MPGPTTFDEQLIVRSSGDSTFANRAEYGEQTWTCTTTEGKSSQFERDVAWEERIWDLLRQHMYIQYIQACISTIGGACFALKRHKSAFAIARAQEQLARVTANTHSLLLAKIHQVYNLIGTGKRKAAIRGLQLIEQAARVENDETVSNMCQVARNKLKSI